MRICIFEHSIVNHFGMVRGAAEIVDELFIGLHQAGVDVTYLVYKHPDLVHSFGNNVIELSQAEIEGLIEGQIPISNYFDGDIFHTQSSGKHVNYDLTGFNGKWVATCHGADSEDAAAEFLVFVGKQQMQNHFNLFHSHQRSKKCYVAYNCYQEGLSFTDGPHDSIVHLSSLRSDKGVHLLPYIANATGRKIELYGSNLYPDYFNQYIAPYLGTLINYNGPIDTIEQKNKMYSTAELFLHPATFNEPFGITLIESMVCGVPFMGFNNGSLPELKPESSVLANDLDDLCEIIKSKLYACSAETLINHASKFNSKNMVSNYIGIYRDALTYPY